MRTSVIEAPPERRSGGVLDSFDPPRRTTSVEPHFWTHEISILSFPCLRSPKL
jgi:hypothetical protein